MSDLIDRQAAIEHIEAEYQAWGDEYNVRQILGDLEDLPSAQPDTDEWCTDCKEYDSERHCCPRWNRVIRKTLKDAQPERKKGKWEITEAYPHNVYCSECHHKFAQTHWAVWEDGTLPRNYCPNCGSYNGGGDDGQND